MRLLFLDFYNGEINCYSAALIVGALPRVQAVKVISVLLFFLSAGRVACRVLCY